MVIMVLENSGDNGCSNIFNWTRHGNSDCYDYWCYHYHWYNGKNSNILFSNMFNRYMVIIIWTNRQCINYYYLLWTISRNTMVIMVLENSGDNGCSNIFNWTRHDNSDCYDYWYYHWYNVVLIEP